MAPPDGDGRLADPARRRSTCARSRHGQDKCLAGRDASCSRSTRAVVSNMKYPVTITVSRAEINTKHIFKIACTLLDEDHACYLIDTDRVIPMIGLTSLPACMTLRVMISGRRLDSLRCERASVPMTLF